jgi:hypothetical protein
VFGVRQVHRYHPFVQETETVELTIELQIFSVSSLIFDLNSEGATFHIESGIHIRKCVLVCFVDSLTEDNGTGSGMLQIGGL